MQDERAATLDWPSGASVQRLVDWFVETEGSKAKNQVLPGHIPHSLRICTFNVHFWLGPTQDRFFCNVDAIMDVVSRCHADVLVLNEFVPIRDTSLLPKVGERLAQMGYTYSTLASSPSWMHVRVGFLPDVCCLFDKNR
jgi:hypothetical protein